MILLNFDFKSLLIRDLGLEKNNCRQRTQEICLKKSICNTNSFEGTCVQDSRFVKIITPPKTTSLCQYKEEMGLGNLPFRPLAMTNGSRLESRNWTTKLVRAKLMHKLDWFCLRMTPICARHP
jgi:hypothetical protein